MRADTANFVTRNIAPQKRPRYVIELAFDNANTVLRYFTSHIDAALPVGANATLRVVEGLSGTSQTLNPDTANATIGNISFTLVDRASIITTTLGGQFELGRSTRDQRVRVYVGYEGLAWADYTLVQTQLVTQISYEDGSYVFQCADIQRQMRNDLYEMANTALQASVSATDTTISVFGTSLFEMVAHGSSYSDAPNATVGYIKIDSEIIRYTGKTATTFTGCTRGALSTTAVAHSVDISLSADQRTQAYEYMYLEMPAVKLMYATMTGVLYGQGGATLPASWNLGISADYVRLSDFTGIGGDLWDTAADDKGFVVRLENVEKTDGKKFMEQELALLCGAFMPIYNDGALGLKRMANVLAGAAYVKQLDASNIVKWDALVHDFSSLHNVIQVTWNWEAAQNAFTRTNVLLDSDSIEIHGRAPTLKFKFRALHGSRHSAITIAQRFDALRDRYTGPPIRTTLQVLPSLNTIEVGDVVRVNPDGMRDFIVSGGLDRSFEVQNVAIDWVTGDISLKLFASSQAPGAQPSTGDASVLPHSFYISQGTPLSSVLTITGSNPGHVTANGNLTGNADATDPSAIYYYVGDLQFDVGVNVNISDNVQLRVEGFFQNNGTINGVGRGLAGGEVGIPGFIGNTQAGGSIGGGVNGHEGGGEAILDLSSYPNSILAGLHPTVPPFNLIWDSVVINGIPSDLRGTSGGKGGNVGWNGGKFGDHGNFPSTSVGGNGGAGFVLICRGFAQGVVGVVNLSGAAGTASTPYGLDVDSNDWLMYPGSGAGGAAGGFLILLDGSGITATGLTETGFVANYGATPIQPGQLESPYVRTRANDRRSSSYCYYVGTGDGTTFPLPSLSGARGGSRVQYVPGDALAEPDSPIDELPAPTGLGLASGTSELLVQGDGTVVPRIKATWTAVLDARVLAYELQFKRSTDTVYSDAPTVSGATSTTAWIVGIRDGVTYDIRIRAVGDVRQESEWVTIEDYLVIGKSEPPADITTFTIEGTTLSWSEVADVDLDGYVLRYQPGTSRSWGDAIPLHNGVVTSSPYDMLIVPSGSVTLMVKALDTSGNESVNAAYIAIDLGDPIVANIVETFDRRAAGFPGTKTNCTVSAGDLVADSITPLMWKPDDTAAMWSVDSALIWATVQYAAMTYVDQINVTLAGLGSRMIVLNDITGDPWSLEYAEDGTAIMWSADSSTPMWNASGATTMWTASVYLPWPGEIQVNNTSYSFRVSTGQAVTQGKVVTFTVQIDMPDIEESFNNIVVAGAGTRLPITKTYRAISNVQLTVQSDGGTAISARTEDKNATLGPLVKGIDAAGSFTSALVDARVQGY